MNTIDLTPLYRSSIGFDRLASMLDNALRSDTSSGGYPPYNIEALGENRYGITIAVAGFAEDELDIQVERDVLTVRGRKSDDEQERNYLYQGIAARAFERKFNLAEHVKVTEAEMRNGLLNIHLVKEVPEAHKPRSISIKNADAAIEHKS
ncbi:heat-shock protein [Aliidiomarina sedimenti]|uniref:Heat-shock protein n=2 Tax=Aliidiomarina TaxID=1249554 RepID=A0A432WJ90_9GAMM|nr:MULTISPECIES: Hsp20 family protein [Aliidiomarina]RUO30780.1 heat-shock protein [Aliidiomarina sedimenti]RUO33853.1 heat-shock protein [Aliidiomarina soli]